MELTFADAVSFEEADGNQSSNWPAGVTQFSTTLFSWWRHPLHVKICPTADFRVCVVNAAVFATPSQSGLKLPSRSNKINSR